MRPLLKLCLILYCVFFASPAQSGMIEVRPTMLVLTPTQRVGVLSVVNPETHPAIYQVRIFKWRQNGDDQILEPTADIIASPPMVTVPNHGSQIIRVGLRASTVSVPEQTYRLILEEVPNTSSPEIPTLNIALRLSFPLFVRANSDVPAEKLTANMYLDGSDAVVTVHNNGPYTSRIVHAALLTSVDEINKKAKLEKLTYILPDSWATYRFALATMPPSFSGTKINIQTDEGSKDLEAPLVAGVITNATAPLAH